MEAKIVVLPGDGIGPEVAAAALRVLGAVERKFGHSFTFSEHLIGGAAIDATGTALPDHALSACQSADAVLLGAVGGPKWDDPTAAVRPEQGLLALRKGLGVFANLRPVRVYPELVEISPLKAEKLAGVDMMVVRELTGGLYFGKPKGRDTVDGHRRAVDTLEYHDLRFDGLSRWLFNWRAGGAGMSPRSTKPMYWSRHDCGGRLQWKYTRSTVM
jgi:3-isopropylmalate dehydrogenase